MIYVEPIFLIDLPCYKHEYTLYLPVCGLSLSIASLRLCRRPLIRVIKTKNELIKYATSMQKSSLFSHFYFINIINSKQFKRISIVKKKKNIDRAVRLLLSLSLSGSIMFLMEILFI